MGARFMHEAEMIPARQTPDVAPDDEAEHLVSERAMQSTAPA